MIDFDYSVDDIYFEEGGETTLYLCSHHFQKKLKQIKSLENFDTDDDFVEDLSFDFVYEDGPSLINIPKELKLLINIKTVTPMFYMILMA